MQIRDCSDVLAYGPFSYDIVRYMPYSQEFYLDTPPIRSGTLVVTYLFGIYEGEAVREFAASLGITDPMDFNQHKLDPAKVDIQRVRSFLRKHAESQGYFDDAEMDKEIEKDLAGFSALRERDFQFIFRLKG